MARDPTGRRHSAWAVAGIVTIAVGATMPWFSAGPASRLGTETSGRWVLLLALAAGVVAIANRRRGDVTWDRWIIVAVVLAGAIALARWVFPPESMQRSLGPLVVAIGAVVTVAALVASRGHGDDPADASTSHGRRPVRTTLVVLGAVFLLVAWVPLSYGSLTADPDPTAGFEEALERFDALVESEDDVFEPCRSNLLHHGAPTDVVVVFFHGLTNCPRQYLELGTALHDAGATVLITRAPGHGIASDDGSAIAGAGALRGLTARQLAHYADESIDIATGLGDDVRVSGLSMGGVISLWVAQHRSDVGRVVAVAPAMELPVVPNVVSTFFTNLFTRVPTLTLSHERHIDHDYAAESTKGLAATFALGQAVADRGLETPPMVEELTVMLNPDDPLVSESDIRELMAAWADAGATVSIVEFDAIGLRHDLIDVGQPNADPDHVYPLVSEALGFPDAWPG